MPAGPPKPLVIEFFGLPGAGKTTLARACAERLGSIFPCVYSKPDLLRRTPWRHLGSRFRWILQEWPIAWPAISLAFRNPPLPLHQGESKILRRLRSALNAPYYLIAVKRIADVNPNSIILLDGWLVMQRIWGNCRRGECQVHKTHKLLAYFESQFDVVLVMLDVDVNEAATRAYRRGIQRSVGLLDGVSRFDHLSQEETAAQLKSRETCVQCLRNRYSTRRARVYALDAALPIEENVETIIKRIVLPHRNSCQDTQAEPTQACGSLSIDGMPSRGVPAAQMRGDIRRKGEGEPRTLR